MFCDRNWTFKWLSNSNSAISLCGFVCLLPCISPTPSSLRLHLTSSHFLSTCSFNFLFVSLFPPFSLPLPITLETTMQLSEPKPWLQGSSFLSRNKWLSRVVLVSDWVKTPNIGWGEFFRFTLKLEVRWELICPQCDNIGGAGPLHSLKTTFRVNDFIY